ncbi:unnamed protein product [Angiostrongylus costaricensis]|uniref:Ribosomal protein S18 n=1 Tax=Angiostrongylus costaricensis TaxID=334426 RepID=A0A0R3PTZ8_ANGCS|nr:unnamed protein product [Angiostrongylus costaricensis]
MCRWTLIIRARFQRSRLVVYHLPRDTSTKSRF